jgi:ribonuclease HI
MKTLIAYTDGAARSNPGPGGWGAVLAVMQTDDETGKSQVVELGEKLPDTTNNQAELTAAIEALQWAQANEVSDVTLYTDSSYLIQGITNWRHNWQQNGWQTKNDEPVKNKQLWQDLIAAQENLDVTYEHVDGHAGIPANERADEIATALADDADLTLFEGERSEYAISLDPEPQLLVDSPVYVSFVDGEVKQHNSWEDCQERVEGVQAQYRKVSTVPERDEVLQKWNKTVEDITE